jgi:hypothetical protein
MIRRKIIKWRVSYNYIVACLNLLIALGMMWFILDIPWEFR